DDDPTRVFQRDDRRSVRQRRTRRDGVCATDARRQQLRGLAAQIVSKRGEAARGGSGKGRVGGQAIAVGPGHCPPFWTYARTKSSAFSSRTSSISSSRSSVSSVSFSRRSWPAAVLAVGSSSSPPPPPRLVCSWAMLPPASSSVVKHARLLFHPTGRRRYCPALRPD